MSAGHYVNCQCNDCRWARGLDELARTGMITLPAASPDGVRPAARVRAGDSPVSAFSVEKIAELLHRQHGISKDKARSVALQQQGIFVPPAEPKRRRAPVQQPIAIPPSDSAAGRWEFLFPMPDAVTNSGGQSRHFRTVAARKRAYRATCDALQLAGELPASPAVPLPRASIAIVMYLGHKMDTDGAVSRCKVPIDWLRSRGFIEDDDPDRLRWVDFPRQVVSRKHVYSIHVTLCALAPDSPP